MRGGHRLVGGSAGFVRKAISLTPLRIRSLTCSFGSRAQFRLVALRLSPLQPLRACGGRFWRRLWGRRFAPPTERCEDSSKFCPVILGFTDRSKTRDIEVAIERAAPERLPVCCAACRGCLKGGADSSCGVFGCGVAGAVQHVDGGPPRSLDRIAKPSCGCAEILTARCPRGDVPLSLSGIGTGGQKLRYQCRGFGRDLVDCPDACGRLAELADGISRL